MNYAITRDKNGCLSIWLNLSGPGDPQLGAITFTLRDDEQERILEALASGEVLQKVEYAIERYESL